jgi:hypothetical protein
MSLKLEELRKRLLQQPHDDSDAQPATEAAEAQTKPDLRAVEVLKTVEIGDIKERPLTSVLKRDDSAPAAPALQSVRPNLAALPKIEGSGAPNQMAESVARLFEQTKTFQVRFDEIAQTVDLIDRMGDSANRVFGPLRTFHTQLTELAASFESMRAFKSQLAQIGKTFEPMRLLSDQLTQISDAIQAHIAHLVKSLDPAKDLRERILTLAHSLEQAGELQNSFSLLYTAFRGEASTAEKLSSNEMRQGATN